MSSTLWHGRFAGSPSEALQALNDSLPFDQRMFREDIAGSRAHVRMLCDVGLFTEAERDGVLAALDTVEQEIESGSFDFQVNDEDIHTAVERRVTELKPAGAKMHTGRSRNDQVATDLRLWTRSAIDEVLERYSLSLEEFASWQRAVDRSGMQGLRVTRIQHYRDLYERQLKY